MHGEPMSIVIFSLGTNDLLQYYSYLSIVLCNHANVKTKMITNQRKDGTYAVLNSIGDIIVPYGKYDWIDKFDHGFARVKQGKETNGKYSSNIKWGIIDKNGKEVVPVIYDNIWNFYMKGLDHTILCLNGHEFHFIFNTREIIQVL